ncbi:MAG: hypothetical protein AB4426_30850 [Xenococcaceae cyanobacterium]
MTVSGQFDLAKIEQLLSCATNPRQKAMYQALLEKAQQQVQQPTKPASEPDASEQTADTADPGALFQAIGVIKGEVNFSDDGKAKVTLLGKEYSLLCASWKRQAYEALKKEIEATGNHLQRLVVYPKAIHFPKRDQPHVIAFQLVGFDKGLDQSGVTQELNDFEFKLRGLWQFIPVCRTPCISIQRNFSKSRVEYIKQADPAKRIKFMKASHLPLLWTDAPLQPFRFNPKAGKNQGHPAFVQVKAKFLPQRDVFGFIEQLAPPNEKAPRFLKASKKDKASIRLKK